MVSGDISAERQSPKFQRLSLSPTPRRSATRPSSETNSVTTILPISFLLSVGFPVTTLKGRGSHRRLRMVADLDAGELPA